MHSLDDLAKILDDLAAGRSSHCDGSGAVRYRAASIERGLSVRTDRDCGDALCDAARAAYGMALREAPKSPPFDSPVRYALLDPAQRMDAEHLPMLAALASRVSVPAARARLHDALWVARDQLPDETEIAPHQHAERAVADYLAAAASPGYPSSDGAALLGRAFVLALELRSHRLRHDVVAAVALAFDVAAAEPRPDSGLLFDLAPLLAEGHASAPEVDAKARIASLHKTLGDDWPAERERVFELQEHLVRGDCAEGDRLRRDRIAMLLELAPSQDGAMRLHVLGSALELARAIPGAGNLRAAIEAEIGVIPRETYNVGKIEFDVDFPAAADVLVPGEDGTVEGVVMSLMSRLTQSLAAASGDDAGGHPPMPLSRIDGRGHPLSGDVSLADALLSISDTFALLSIAVPHLDEMRRRSAADGTPIAARLESPYISNAHANAFARSLEHYWHGRFDEAVAVALPRIEGVLRTVLASAGDPIRTGQDEYAPLGAVLARDALRVKLGEEWHEWFRATFTDKQGRNLRNIFTHGELVPAGHEEAVLVLIAVLFLAALSDGEADPGSA